MKKFLSFAVFVIVILAMVVAATSEDNGSSKNSKSDVASAIELKEPNINGGISLEKALKERRSVRSFGKDGLSLDEVSCLLWAAQGITDDKGHRTAPSGFESYPLQVYLLAGNVTGLPSGVYHYSPRGHNLTVITQGNIDEYYNASTSFEDWIKTAPAIFIITGNPDPLKEIVNRMSLNITDEQLIQEVYLEAGMAAENLLLEVVSLNLGATYTAGFNASEIERLLGLPENEMPIGVIPVGRMA